MNRFPHSAQLRSAALVACCLTLLTATFAAVPSGAPAPDFSFTDAAGMTRQLSEFRGRVVVLEWLNPACPYVVRHYRSGNLPDTQAAAAAQGAVWLQINSTAVGDLDPAKSAEWQTKNSVTATAYIRDQSGRIGRLYGAKTTPHLYIIGRDGRIAYQGAIDDQPHASQANTRSAHNFVKAALAALQAGRNADPAQTEPYGCEVKYGGDGS